MNFNWLSRRNRIKNRPTSFEGAVAVAEVHRRVAQVR